MDLDQFTRGYIEAALWSSTDNAIEEGGDSHPDSNGGWPLDANYSIDDIDDRTLKIMIADCRLFRESNAELLASVMGRLGRYETSRYTEARAGHDFWLTRNGHGAGFWDRGLGEPGDRLTDACKTFGEFNLYVEGGKVFAD